MREAIPPEDHDEAARWIREALPFLDKDVLDELTADYLLAATICIDIEDLRCALAGRTRIRTQVTYDVDVAEISDTTVEFVQRALVHQGNECPPRAIVVLFRTPPHLKLTQLFEVIKRLQSLFDEEQILLLYGDFIDLDATHAKIRVFVAT